MVIRHEVFAPLRGQFENLGPHPANREVAMLSIKDNKLILISATGLNFAASDVVMTL